MLVPWVNEAEPLVPRSREIPLGDFLLAKVYMQAVQACWLFTDKGLNVGGAGACAAGRRGKAASADKTRGKGTSITLKEYMYIMRALS